MSPVCPYRSRASTSAPSRSISRTAVTSPRTIASRQAEVTGSCRRPPSFGSQVALRFRPRLEHPRGDVAPLQLLAELQPQEAAVREARDFQVVRLFHVLDRVHVPVDRVVVDREAFVV